MDIKLRFFIKRAVLVWKTISRTASEEYSHAIYLTKILTNRSYCAMDEDEKSGLFFQVRSRLVYNWLDLVLMH